MRRVWTFPVGLVCAVMVMAGCDATEPADLATSGEGMSQTKRPDLDVTFIERTPRYFRYDLVYVDKTADKPWGLPQLCPDNVAQKRWPAVGETVTYTGHVRNKGRGRSPRAVYEWRVNGEAVAKGRLPRLAPGDEATVRLQRVWSEEPTSIELRVDPRDTIRETAEGNNVLAVGSRDLTIAIWVESGLYALFNETTNLVGTRSFEDWIQAQFAAMNERFSQARYAEVAPGGIIDRVKIEKIVVREDLDGAGITGAACVHESVDPDKVLIDGRWFFKDDDPTNTAGRNGAYQSYVSQFAGRIDWGLVHELAHQLGVIDLYRMNLENDPPNNDRFHVRDLSGVEIAAERLPTFAFSQILFEFPGLMAGGDTRPYRDTTFFESHTAAGMNSHAGQRRGYFGEYLFDTPAQTFLRVFDEGGAPIAGATVQLYQRFSTGDFDDVPEMVVTTDANGRAQLPNRPVTPVSTATGHTLRPNPFGQISHEGTNGTLFVRALQGGQERWGWLFVHDLNLAFWAGNEQATECTVTLWPPRTGGAQPVPTRPILPCGPVH